MNFFQAAVVLSVVAIAAAGVIHGYGGESYGHEAVAYAPVAQLSHYEGHDEHVDYHVRIMKYKQIKNKDSKKR